MGHLHDHICTLWGFPSPFTNTGKSNPICQNLCHISRNLELMNPWLTSLCEGGNLHWGHQSDILKSTRKTASSRVTTRTYFSESLSTRNALQGTRKHNFPASMALPVLSSRIFSTAKRPQAHDTAALRPNSTSGRGF